MVAPTVEAVGVHLANKVIGAINIEVVTHDRGCSVECELTYTTNHLGVVGECVGITVNRRSRRGNK